MTPRYKVNGREFVTSHRSGNRLREIDRMPIDRPEPLWRTLIAVALVPIGMAVLYVGAEVLR